MTPARARAAVPPLALLGLWFVGLALADLAPAAVAAAALPPYAAALVVGPGVVYALMRRRSAGVSVAVVGALAVPLLWIAKECWQMSRLYSAGEALFYAANPIALGLLTAAACQMAAAELIVRRRCTGAWALASGPGLILATVAALAVGLTLALQPTGPTAVFWAYVGLHRWLFGGS